MNVYGGLKWMLWLMCNCDFLGKVKKTIGRERELNGKQAELSGEL